MATAANPPTPPSVERAAAKPAAKPGGRPTSIRDKPDLEAAAIQLLRTPTALADLSSDDARIVVSHMWSVAYNTGAVLLREGDTDHTGFMLLLLSGEVSVQLEALQPGAPTVISVLGAGHLIGEMGVIDGAPRSTQCVAVNRVEAAALTRAALHQLIETEPGVSARLMSAVAQRLSERLRAAADQLRIYAQLVAGQQAEIARLSAA